MVDLESRLATVHGAPQFITPTWQAPRNVLAASTTRVGGCSTGPYNGFNLGAHVGDMVEHVAVNRRLLVTHLQLPTAPLWLEQVHGSEVLYARAQADRTDNDNAESDKNLSPPVADAVWTDQPGVVLAIMTADCLPVLLASDCGTVVAAIHGGWRGLAKGILQKTVAKLPVPGHQLTAWMGPAIGPTTFEVGDEVKAEFINQSPTFSACFKSSPDYKSKCFADIFTMAELCLNEAGITRVTSDRICTVSDAHLFFSHRRDQGKSGRMATLIWRT